jgi:hypothetical protein
LYLIALISSLYFPAADLVLINFLPRPLNSCTPSPGTATAVCYLFPLDLLCVLHNIWQFLISVVPPLLQAATWSASISVNFQMFFLLASGPRAQSGQFDLLSFSASFVCVE